MKSKEKKGISLIVLIITIIVIIILSSTVILTLSKNNLIGSAREAKFKENIRSFQSELSLSINKKYSMYAGMWDDKIDASTFNDIKEAIPSFTKQYDGKIYIINNVIYYDQNNVTTLEEKWFKDLNIDAAPNFPDEWKNTIASVTKDRVPIPKGFTYVEGEKDTGVVIKDELDNEFVWIPATENNYVKDLTFSSYANISDPSKLSDGILVSGVDDETYDVKKYGGFYVARYEAGIPEGQTSSINAIAIPVSKKNVTVWTDQNYYNATRSACQMINTQYVKSGLLTGRAWDRTCHFLEENNSEINILDSRSFGNYNNSITPANVQGKGTKQKSGYSDKWKAKNIYDFAGNVAEWTCEAYNNIRIRRGGRYNQGGDVKSVSYRENDDLNATKEYIGFRVRLYIM